MSRFRVRTKANLSASFAGFNDDNDEVDDDDFFVSTKKKENPAKKSKLNESIRSKSVSNESSNHPPKRVTVKAQRLAEKEAEQLRKAIEASLAESSLSKSKEAAPSSAKRQMMGKPEEIDDSIQLIEPTPSPPVTTSTHLSDNGELIRSGGKTEAKTEEAAAVPAPETKKEEAAAAPTPQSTKKKKKQKGRVILDDDDDEIRRDDEDEDSHMYSPPESDEEEMMLDDENGDGLLEMTAESAPKTADAVENGDGKRLMKVKNVSDTKIVIAATKDSSSDMKPAKASDAKKPIKPVEDASKRVKRIKGAPKSVNTVTPVEDSSKRVKPIEDASKPSKSTAKAVKPIEDASTHSASKLSRQQSGSTDREYSKTLTGGQPVKSKNRFQTSKPSSSLKTNNSPRKETENNEITNDRPAVKLKGLPLWRPPRFVRGHDSAVNPKYTQPMKTLSSNQNDQQSSKLGNSSPGAPLAGKFSRSRLKTMKPLHPNAKLPAN